jgi:hypothetical protein
MKSEISLVSLAAASGKTISSAEIVSEAKDVYGVLLIFTDGTELSIDFYPQNIHAEVRHYRWDENGDANTVTPD